MRLLPGPSSLERRRHIEGVAIIPRCADCEAPWLPADETPWRASRMNANSAAKISQINQLAANATCFKTLDDASASITKTGISARVAALQAARSGA